MGVLCCLFGCLVVCSVIGSATLPILYYLAASTWLVRDRQATTQHNTMQHNTTHRIHCVQTLVESDESKDSKHFFALSGHGQAGKGLREEADRQKEHGEPAVE